MAVSLRDQAYQRIKQAMVENQIRAGDVISVSDLMARFGLGRTPVREALLKLHDEGIVHIIPRKGVVVPGITGDRVRDLMELRMALEMFAVEKVCLMPDRSVSQRLFAYLNSVLEVQQEALQSGDDELFILKDQEMHMAIVEAGGNLEFKNTLNHIREEVLRAGFTGLAVPLDYGEAFREHRAIVAAIGENNATEAREGIRAHLTRSKRMVLAF